MQNLQVLNLHHVPCGYKLWNLEAPKDDLEMNIHQYLLNGRWEQPDDVDVMTARLRTISQQLRYLFVVDNHETFTDQPRWPRLEHLKIESTLFSPAGG